MRTSLILGERIEARYGKIDLAAAVEILRTPELVDDRDSMNAVIFEPELLMMHVAMGQVPATDGDFLSFHLPSLLAGNEAD